MGKLIVIASLSKRLLAKLFDFILGCGLTSLVFFLGVYPASFDKDLYIENQNLIVKKYDESGLFLKSKKGTIVSKGAYRSIDTLEELTSATLFIDDEKFENVNITKSLVEFYTLHLIDFDYENNLSFEVFKSTILNKGSEISNIKDLEFINGEYNYILIDDKDEYSAVVYITELYTNATKIVDNSKYINDLTNKNIALMSSSLVYFIPIFFGFSLIFDLIIPLILKNGQTLGKLIFKTAILTKDGYEIKLYQVLLRRVSYLVIEVALGVLTCFGTILISYTMLMFNKKKRTIDDYVAGTMVVDKANSFWFKNKEDEQRYEERYAHRVI